MEYKPPTSQRLVQLEHAELELKILKLQKTAECAVNIMRNSLMLLFTHERQVFDPYLVKRIFQEAKHNCPTSLEAYLELEKLSK